MAQIRRFCPNVDVFSFILSRKFSISRIKFRKKFVNEFRNLTEWGVGAVGFGAPSPPGSAGPLKKPPLRPQMAQYGQYPQNQGWVPPGLRQIRPNVGQILADFHMLLNLDHQCLDFISGHRSPNNPLHSYSIYFPFN